MPRGPERPWRAQRGPHLDGHILAAIQRAAELVEDELEPGKPLDAESALEVRRALYRAARRQGVALSAKVVRDPTTGRVQVRFRVYDKAAARAYMVTKYGADRSRWPYNPRYRQPREDQQ